MPQIANGWEAYYNAGNCHGIWQNPFRDGDIIEAHPSTFSDNFFSVGFPGRIMWSIPRQFVVLDDTYVSNMAKRLLAADYALRNLRNLHRVNTSYGCTSFHEVRRYIVQNWIPNSREAEQLILHVEDLICKTTE